MLVLDVIRPYAEIAAFISTSVLAISLLFARSQLISFKNDVKIRNERQSKEKAIEASNLYMSEFIDLHRNFYHEKIESNIKNYKGKIGNFLPSSLSREEKENGLGMMSLVTWN
ncbi:MAG: hypothetical protein KKA44_00425 [Alphaproteobacteria bacterium]|nr:hypothetical protein [Alphaproteobacteria bacterium]